MTQTLKEKLTALPNLIRTIGAISLCKKDGMKHSVLYREILDATSFMAPDTKFDVRIWSIIHNLNDYARCPCGCGTILPHPFKRDYIKGHAAKCAHIKKKTEQVNLERHGAKSNLCKGTESRKRIEETNLQRYGAKSILAGNSIIRKEIEQKNLDMYGSRSLSVIPSVREKIKATFLEKYGVDNVAKHPDIIEKSKQTNQRKYGVDNVMQISSVVALIQGKNREAFLESLFNGDRLEGKVTPMFTKEEYKGCFHKHLWKCNTCGGNFLANLNDGSTPRCFICDPPHFGVMQNEVYQWLHHLMPNELIRQNDRSLIYPLELDFTIPSKKIAIEFNGIYWHSDKFKNKDYHLEKTEICEKVGWRLVHVFEDEWQNSQQIVRAKLRSILGLTRYKIGARQCKIGEVDPVLKAKFLQKYHIQGNDNASHFNGLFYKGRLVALMTFSKSRFSDRAQWELVRYAGISSFNIVGGASRLLSHFRSLHPADSIVTYADKRWSQGNMYHQLGFSLSHSSGPGYRYVRGESVLTRYQCQKHKLAQLLENFDPALTEEGNMANNGWQRVYDCGNLVFVLDGRKPLQNDTLSTGQ